MNDKKTPAQAAEFAWEYATNRGESREEKWQRVAYSVLAHADPKWHPTSEPVPEDGLYHFRTKEGNVVHATTKKGSYHSTMFTHWQGPIRPTPFEEKA